MTIGIILIGINLKINYETNKSTKNNVIIKSIKTCFFNILI